MKKTIFTSLFVLLCMTSCDFLTQTPKDELTPEDYFKTETDLQLFTNPLYNNLLDDEPYNHQSDHCINLNLSNELHGGTFRTVPNSGGGWTWTNIRRINTLLEYSVKCEDEAVRNHYNAIARFFRAYNYYEFVKRFGDVPWIEKELTQDSEELYKPRDSRELILTKMIEDIDFAIETLPATISTYRVNKYAALALKAEFCLYEGTFRKYHAGKSTLPNNLPADAKSYDYYLDLAAKAAKEVMDCGLYRLAPDYLTLFAQIDADQYEYILAIKQDLSLQIYNNSTAYATMPTQGCPGLTKKFVDSFLMKDGSRFTDKEGWETMTFKDEVADRDPRLACCTVTPGYKRIGGIKVVAPDLGSSSTGFQLVKYVMDETLPQVNRVDMSYNDMPVYRLAEMYLIYAEAKAELGTLTQDDLDVSVNLLRDRVGMPHMNMQEANANPDPYLLSETYGYRHIANVATENLGVILEIRRERSIELFKEGHRWDDLMRWREGLCIDQPMHGPYFPELGEYDLSGDNKPDICLWKDKEPDDKEGVAKWEVGKTTGIILSNGTTGYVDPQQGNQHLFNEERDYFYPIPINERTLNPNLSQNPNWKDGLSSSNE